MFDLELIKEFYNQYITKLSQIRSLLKKPLTLTEKILYSHVSESKTLTAFGRGKDYVFFSPDRVGLQDATAQMALLQFMMAGKKKVAVPSTVHCDHLILAQSGADKDLSTAQIVNGEVYDFLESAATKYGLGFWKPGAGIIHQVILENYAFPGGMMVGTDSHTVNAGGLGMIAIGVGGADAVDVMVGIPWELRFPKLIGVKLIGELNGWTSAKDVILTLAGILTVKGGTGAIVEYFGKGADSISCTGKGTICNMGAEIGATTSVFGYDDKMREYLQGTGRSDVVDIADPISADLKGDLECYEQPEKYFDRVITVNLSELEPHINGPFTPDLATPISEFKEAVIENEWPKTISVGLIGSCTNSSYEDITRAASIAQQAIDKKLSVKSQFTVTPGSEQIRFTVERDGYLNTFQKIGGVVLSNACGPCIGQWNRDGADKQEKNSILTSFNRNFAKRNDGNPNTHGFVASPEIVTAMAIAGDMSFNPLTDPLVNEDGEEVYLDEPNGIDFPPNGFAVEDAGYQSPSENRKEHIINIDPNSERLQLLTPFRPWNGENLTGLKLLIKVKGKCTTDHMSMAGPWLRYRGHLDHISNNCFIGAVNAFNEKSNSILNPFTDEYAPVPEVQRHYQQSGIGTLVVGDENYGEGSSREHAAMEPRHLGVRVILVKSFARIHETNLKKQGMLALTFVQKSDYDLIQEKDIFDLIDLNQFSPGEKITILVKHSDDSEDYILCNHSYNDTQIHWFKAGSALNLLAENKS